MNILKNILSLAMLLVLIWIAIGIHNAQPFGYAVPNSNVIRHDMNHATTAVAAASSTAIIRIA